MNDLIGVSTQCFYFWADQSKWASEQLRIIGLLRPYTQRLELYFSVEDFLNMTDKALDEYIRELGTMKRSLHLPSLSQDVSRIEEVLGKIEEVTERLSIEYCVLHADEYVLLKMKKSNINFGFKLGLENSDVRKFGFQHLRDLGLFDLPVVLDIDHIDEMMKSSLDQELSGLSNPLLAIHFSTPKNDYFKKFPEIETTHFPFARSGVEPPSKLPNGVPMVIEGVIPPNEIEMVKEEIDLISSRYFDSNFIHSSSTQG